LGRLSLVGGYATDKERLAAADERGRQRRMSAPVARLGLRDVAGG